jgi:hypothetical protein
LYYLRCFVLVVLALAAVSRVVGVFWMQGDALLHSHHPRAAGGGRGNQPSVEEEAT